MKTDLIYGLKIAHHLKMQYLLHYSIYLLFCGYYYPPLIIAGALNPDVEKQVFFASMSLCFRNLYIYTVNALPSRGSFIVYSRNQFFHLSVPL